MDRRRFLLHAGGTTVAATPFLGTRALAGPFLPPRAPGNAGRVWILHQTDLPATAGLATMLAKTLRDVGYRDVPLPVSADVLRQGASAQALLALPRDALLLAVVDDASAVILQAMAASRGARFLARGHHRLRPGGARHACAAIGCGETFVWTENPGKAAAPIQAVYLAALGARAGSSHEDDAFPASTGTGDAISSFLVRL